MIKYLLDYLYYYYECISHRIPFFAQLFIKIHEPAVKREISMLKLISSDKILHIGCGAIPYTSIIISKETDAIVVGIDHHQKIVENANFYLEKYNLSNKVKIEIGDGETHDVSNFNIIILSYGLRSHDLVLKHIFNSIKNGGKILLRRAINEKNKYVDSIVKNYSVNRIQLLLTQESVLIVKKK